MIAQCDEQYERIEELDSELRESGFYDGDEENGGPSTPTAHFRALRDVYDAVEDVQAQALARELEYVKEMAHDGRSTPSTPRSFATTCTSSSSRSEVGGWHIASEHPRHRELVYAPSHCAKDCKFVTAGCHVFPGRDRKIRSSNRILRHLAVTT